MTMDLRETQDRDSRLDPHEEQANPTEDTDARQKGGWVAVIRLRVEVSDAVSADDAWSKANAIVITTSYEAEKSIVIHSEQGAPVPGAPVSSETVHSFEESGEAGL